MRVREATISDSESLAALCITVWIDTYCKGGIEPSVANYVLTAYTPDRLVQTINEKRVLVAEHAGNIVGLVVLHPQSGEIETLYVLPGFQGRGVGSVLLKEIRTGFNGRLFLTCWEKNESAIGFYKTYGFVETGEAYFHLDGQAHRNIELSLS